MAAHGDYNEPLNYDQDQKSSKYGKTKPRKDHQKNKYHKTEKYGQKKIQYQQKEKEKTHYQEQKKTYGTYGLNVAQKRPTWKYVENYKQEKNYSKTVKYQQDKEYQQEEHYQWKK